MSIKKFGLFSANGNGASANNPGVNRWHRALVTGASSGIGKAFAQRLAEQSSNLVLVARDQLRLNNLADQLRSAHNVEVEVLTADLSDRAQVALVVERLNDQASPIDLLVNNAGLGYSGDFIELDPDSETNVIDVNVTAMHRLAHAAGTVMASRGRGGILNVSSVVGFAPMAGSATYAATKAFVTSFSEALHAELGPQGVVVTCLCPGLTRTEFQQRAKVDTEPYPDALWQEPGAVVDAGLGGLNKGKAVVVSGAKNKMISGALRATPSSFVRRASKVLSSSNK